MKEKIIYGLMILVGVVLAYDAIQKIDYPEEALANRSSLSVCTLEGDGTYNAVYSAASLRYMTAGNSTTTLTCSTGGTDQVDLLIALKASSTNTNLGYWVEYSRNGADYYQAGTDFDIGVGNGVASTSIQLASNYTKYFIKYASTTAEENQSNTDTLMRRVQIKDIGAPYMRIKFFLPVAGGPILATSSNAGFQVEQLRKIQKL